jgi:UDP-glucuronate decarboxylase
MIDALILMMKSEHSGPFNLGNPNCEFTLNKLVNIFEQQVNRKIDIIYLNSTQDDPKMRKPIIEKATQYLNWKPVILLDEGIKKTMDYFIKNSSI